MARISKYEPRNDLLTAGAFTLAKRAKKNKIQVKSILFIFLIFIFHGLWAEESPSSKKQPPSVKPKEKKKDKQSQQGTEEVKATPYSPHTFTGSVTFISDYRSRGISQTMRRPAIQGEMKYSHVSGFYFKNWASNVDGTDNFINNTSMEWDLYLGIQRPLFQTVVKYDVGFLFYYYPGGRAFVPRQPRYDSVEYYLGIAYKGFNIKFYQTLTDYFGVNSSNPPFNWGDHHPSPPNGHSRLSTYIEANFEWSPIPKWTTSLHVGYQTVTNYSQLDYLDWQLGLTYKFAWFDLSLYYVATNALRDYYDVPDHAFKPSTRRLGGPGGVLGVTRSF